MGLNNVRRPKRLPNESDEEYERFCQEWDSFPLYLQAMMLEEAKYRENKFIVSLSKVDIWILRLLLILIGVVMVSQFYILTFES